VQEAQYDRVYRYRQHLAVLIETHREIAGQARYRPRLKVPPETLRIVRRQLYEMRKFRAACGVKTRTFPALPGGTLRFSTLSLLLAVTRREFENFGKAFQYHTEPEARGGERQIPERPRRLRPRA
jgi:hypothetical protein